VLAALLALALAHPVGTSTSEIAVERGGIEATARFALADVARVARLHRNADGRPEEAEPQQAGPAAAGEILDHFSFLQGGERCRVEPASLEARLEPPDGIAVRGRWSCPRPGEAVQLRLGLVGGLPAGHVHLARVRIGEGVQERVLRAGADVLDLAAAPSAGREAGRFLRLGVEHIFAGYDHLAFLLGLLLLGGTVGGLVRVVTSFTAAHSLTLALAASGLVGSSPRLVEPLIAASVVAVAAENLWALRSGGDPGRALRRRWAVSFAFGLVHGFGFAGVLRELGLPRGALAGSLLSFNVGVELGQVAVVAAVWPLLAWLRRRPGFVPGGVRAGSAAVGALGVAWLVLRVGAP